MFTSDYSKKCTIAAIRKINYKNDFFKKWGVVLLIKAMIQQKSEQQSTLSGSSASLSCVIQKDVG